MTETTTRAPRTKREHGLMAQCVVCVPVDKGNLRAQLQVEEAFIKATETGDMQAILALPGVRISRTERKHRFGALPKIGEAAGADDGGQGDIEDLTGGEQEPEAKDPPTDDKEAEEQATEDHPAGKGKRRHAA